jgi:hypothetical protein
VFRIRKYFVSADPWSLITDPDLGLGPINYPGTGLDVVKGIKSSTFNFLFETANIVLKYLLVLIKKIVGIQIWGGQSITDPADPDPEE